MDAAAGTDVDGWGVQQHWVDADDRPQRISDETVARVREVIGVPSPDLESTAPVVTRPGRATGLHGRVTCEDGQVHELHDVLDDDFPLGYHRLETDAGERRLIVSPGRCWVPEHQAWGWSVQLYAAMSAESQGIGDLADLGRLRAWTEAEGGGFLIVNPLHAVAPVLPLEASPYLPATRRFRNPVYLHVEGLAPILRVSGAPGIDRDAAWTAKLRVLREAFEAREDDASFDEWRRLQGQGLQDFAVWSVLAQRHGGDFRTWPEALRDPRGDAVAQEASEAAGDVTFHAWLQWLLSEQLREATGDLTVIQDLPIGVSGGGADSWAWQGVLAGGITVGAPPDALNTAGQDWGSPPLVPWRLRAADYEPFIESVRATIAGAGGLRVDHVMGLFRLWWIPDGVESTDGCYVHYPADDLLDILCLESYRAHAVVVGEDLGTVADGVREALAERGILGYRVLWFEDDDPAEWSPATMAAVTTHDLPTVAGLWTGSDAEDQRRSSDMEEADIEEGRAELLARLQRDGLAEGADVDDAVVAAYRQLGRAPSLLRCLALEDAVAEELRPNIPGTVERDNWRIPLRAPLEDVLASTRAGDLVREVAGGRSGTQ